MEQKMTAQDLVLNLKAAGFDTEMMEKYLSCWKNRDVKGQLKLLSVKRVLLLEQVHREEKQIGSLDYLVYQIEKGQVTV